MRKLLICLCVFLMLVIAGCASRGNAAIELTDKLFLSQVNDIFTNSSDYIGETVRYEGIFISDLDSVDPYCMVYRYGPNCCVTDGVVGFEVAWTGPYPENDTWVAVEGVLESYALDGETYLRLSLSSLKELPVRGEEYVYQ